MADPLLAQVHPSDNTFQRLFNRGRAVANIILHLLVYNYAMLALATSLPTSIMPHFLDFSIRTPPFLSIVFPITAAFISYLSASYIFTHVNLYAEKHLIPIPRVAQCTEHAYPSFAIILIFSVTREVIHILGARHAWIWTLRLGACCIIEVVFLFSLLFFCSALFPKFGEGMGPVFPEVPDHTESVV